MTHSRWHICAPSSERGEQPLTSQGRQSILRAATEMAGAGLRIIASAEKRVMDGPLSQDAAESELTFVGLAGLAGQPRQEVKQAIADCQTAGIR